jgi:transcriptional regulator with XRE-family HTH domain
MRRLTLEELARRSGLAKGTLSKIENARLIPNLPTLAEIARQLGIGLDGLVRGAEGPPPQPWRVLRAGERQVVARDDAVGMRYEALVSLPHPAGVLEGYHLTVEPGAKRRAVTTEGRQLVLLLEGRIEFVLGDETVVLAAGDLLEFDGHLPHVPRNPWTRPARLLAWYLLPASAPVA